VTQPASGGRARSAGLFRFSRQEGRWLLSLMALAFLLRLALIVGFETYRLPEEDDHLKFAAEYGRIARAIAVGQGYACPYELDKGGPTVKGVPLFPAYLALLFRLFGVYSPAAACALLITSSAVYVAGGALVYAVGRRLFGRQPARLGALLFWFEPLGVMYSANYTWETALSAAALMVPPALFLWIEEGPSIRKGLLAGLAVGVLANLNAAIGPVCAVLALWLVVRSRGRRGAMVRALVPMALAGVLCLVPWSVRNTMVSGRPMLVRGEGWVTFFIGNHDGAKGDLRDEKHAYLLLSPEERALYYSLGETGYEAHCRKRAIAFVERNPARYAMLGVKRAYLFSVGDIIRTAFWRAGLMSGLRSLRWQTVCHLLIGVAALAGLVSAIWQRRPVWPIAGQVLGYAPPYILIYCAWYVRYRMPLQGSLLLLCSVALDGARRRFARERTGRSDVVAPHEDL